MVMMRDSLFLNQHRHTIGVLDAPPTNVGVSRCKGFLEVSK